MAPDASRGSTAPAGVSFVGSAGVTTSGPAVPSAAAALPNDADGHATAFCSGGQRPPSKENDYRSEYRLRSGRTSFRVGATKRQQIAELHLEIARDRNERSRDTELHRQDATVRRLETLHRAAA